MAADRAQHVADRDRAGARAGRVGRVRPLRAVVARVPGRRARPRCRARRRAQRRRDRGPRRPTSWSCSTWPTRSRAARQGAEPDRLEAEGDAFHAAVRAAYRDARADEHGWVVVDGERDRRRRSPGASGTARRAGAGRMTSTMIGIRAVGPGGRSGPARSRCCSAPPSGRCTRTCSSARGAPASRRRRVASRPRWSRPTRRPLLGPRAAGRASRRGRDRPAGDPDPGRGRAADRRRGVPQPDRGRAQGDPPVRRRAAPAQRGRRQQAAEDARGAAAPGDDRARHVGRRPAAADDPVALPARRLRVPRRRSRSRPRSAADGVAPERAELLRAPRRRTARPGPRARRSPRAGARRVRRGGRRRRRQRGRGRGPGGPGPGRDAGRGHRARGRAGRGGASSSPSELEAAGYPDRAQRAQLRRLEEQHKRAHRRARTDALLEGITALETVYRDALAGPGAEPLNLDREVLALSPRGAAAALDACREARQALAEFNPNETLLLERLLLHLPAAGDGSRCPARAPHRARYTRRRAGVAQTAEQLTRNEQAKGSSPFSGSKSVTNITGHVFRFSARYSARTEGSKPPSRSEG